MTRGKISITFDDALTSVYSLALPIMEQFDIYGTVFAISDFVGRKWNGHPVMSRRMLSRLCSAGWEIGSHTKSHRMMTDLSPSELKEELASSKKELESFLPGPVTSLAYPYSELNETVVPMVSKYYTCARTVSAYPPLRLNQFIPHNPMRLEAMWSCEPAFTLPLHLAPRVLRQTMMKVVPPRTRSKNFKEFQDVLNANLNGRIVAKWVETTVKKNRWLILCFHNITTDITSSWYSISIDEFRKIIKAISRGPEVVTLRRAFSN